MHTFQPIPSDLFDFSPFRMIGKEWMLITAESEGKTNAMTASWGGLGVMWGKDVAYIVVRDSRYTRELIDRSNSFSISFLNADYHSALKYLGAVSGRDEDKITNARLHVNYHEKIPFIDEASTVMVCKKMCKQPLTPENFTMDSICEKWYSTKDYHNLYIGEIVSILAR
ncbi:MAG: flavin reductase family protein [Acetivibrio sp.]